MRLRARAFVVTGLVSGLFYVAACTLAVSTSGLAGPSEGAAAAETSPDARLDAPDAPAESGGHFCAQHMTAALCADFDESNDPAAGWTDRVMRGASTVALDPDAISRPTSLLASVSASDAGDVSARVYRELEVVPTAMHVELDARLCAMGTGVEEFLKLEFPAASIAPPTPGFESSGVAVSIRDGRSTVSVERYNTATKSFRDDYPLLPGAPVGRWFHLALDVKLSTSATGSIRLAFDGAGPSLDVHDVPTLTQLASGARVVTGVYTGGVPTSCVNRIDNVLVELTP